MNRNALIYLKKWLVESRRKPMVMRGARQVGKTWLVRELAKEANLQLIEFNFEKEPAHKALFSGSNEPEKIMLEIESFLNKSIDKKNTLLFLDEIQAYPELLAKLRWFYEDMPELPVIATGSLLDFALENHTFSMPVGRITYMHIEPLSFEEFLIAHDRSMLCDYLRQYQLGAEISLPIHNLLLSFFKEYIIVGGLPAAVADWITHKSLEKVHQTQQDLIATYRDDFSKYANKTAIEHCNDLFYKVPKLLGKKLIYRHVNPDVQTQPIKKALDLLCKAHICHRVLATHANGVPLGAEIRDKSFKVILLDTGLVSAFLKLPLHQINQVSDINLVNQGAIAEQVTGQLLRTITPFYIEPRSYYWSREESNASSEVDYLIQHNTHIIPIEVKSGTTGTLKSLHYFMAEKKLSWAVRINSDFPSITSIDVKTNTGKKSQYTLLSIPFYLIEQLPRLLDEKLLGVPHVTK